MSGASATAPTEVLDALLAGVRSGAVAVVDLTHPLSPRTPMIELPPPFAQAPGWELEEISRYDARGPMFHWNRFSGSEHMGTHLDAPVHWITGRDGEDVAAIAPERLFGPAAVIDRVAEVARDPDDLLRVEDVLAFQDRHGRLEPGTWLLVRTGWSARHDDAAAFLGGADSRWPGIDPACARFLAEETDILGLGVECVGIDAGRAYAFDPPYPAHHHLLGAGKLGLASLANLERLPVTGAAVLAAPLRIERGTGSPARVLAFVPEGARLDE